jgi:hypothetical protein
MLENTFQELDLSPSTDEGREKFTLLGPLKRANLNHLSTSRFINVVFYSIWNSGLWTESRNPVIRTLNRSSLSENAAVSCYKMGNSCEPFNCSSFTFFDMKNTFHTTKYVTTHNYMLAPASTGRAEDLVMVLSGQNILNLHANMASSGGPVRNLWNCVEGRVLYMCACYGNVDGASKVCYVCKVKAALCITG